MDIDTFLSTGTTGGKVKPPSVKYTPEEEAQVAAQEASTASSDLSQIDKELSKSSLSPKQRKILEQERENVAKIAGEKQIEDFLGESPSKQATKHTADSLTERVSEAFKAPAEELWRTLGVEDIAHDPRKDTLQKNIAVAKHVYGHMFDSFGDKYKKDVAAVQAAQKGKSLVGLHGEKQTFNDLHAVVAAPVQMGVGALKAAHDFLIDKKDFKAAQKAGEEYSQNIIKIEPSPGVQTAMALAGQGFNILGTSVGVMSAEFKRLFNRDMSLEDYQDIVGSANYLTQVATIGYVPTKALAVRGTALTKALTKAAAESYKNRGKKIVDPDTIDPENLGVIKHKEEATTEKEKPATAPKEPLTKEDTDRFNWQQKVQQAYRMRGEKEWKPTDIKEATAGKSTPMKMYSFGGWEDIKSILDKLINIGSSSAIKETARAADDLLHIMRNVDTLSEMEAKDKIIAAEKAGVTSEVGAKFRAYHESGEVFSPEEKELYTEYAVPELAEYQENLREYRKLGGMSALDVDENFFPRFAIGKGGFIDRFLALSEEGISGYGLGRSSTPSSARTRTIYAIEHPDGSRSVVSIGKNKAVVSWEDGTPTVLGKWEGPLTVGKELEGGNLDGSKLVHSTQEEAATHTDVRYLPNGYEALVRKNQELKAAIAQRKAIQYLTTSPEFKDVIAHEDKIPKEDMRELLQNGWRPVDSKVQMLFPEMKGKLFDANIAETIEDYLKPTSQLPAAKVYRALTNFLLKALFLNPVPHINNEGLHWIPERGLEWISPKGYSRLVKTGKPAMSSVLKQDKFQRELLQNGASLFMPSMENDRFLKKRIDAQLEAAVKHEGFKSIAKSVGLSPVKLAQEVSNLSGRVMWTFRDAMYTQAIMEHMERVNPKWRDLSTDQRAPLMKEAIKEVERHMPSYRIPNRVLNSRALAKLMKNPYLTVFSYYHYGMVKSFAEFGRSLILDPIQGKFSKEQLTKRAITAVGQMAAIGIIYSMLYPAVDKGFSDALGREVKARRAGGFALLEAVQKMAIEHDEDPEALLRAIITPAPVTYNAVSLFFNRDLFTFKPIHKTQDPWGRQAKDVAKFIGTTPSPAKLAQRTIEGPRSVKEVLQDQFLDIKDMSQEKKRVYFKLKDYLTTLRQRAMKGEEISPDEWERVYELQRKLGEVNE